MPRGRSAWWGWHLGGQEQASALAAVLGASSLLRPLSLETPGLTFRKRSMIQLSLELNVEEVLSGLPGRWALL